MCLKISISTVERYIQTKATTSSLLITHTFTVSHHVIEHAIKLYLMFWYDVSDLTEIKSTRNFDKI